MEQLQAQLSELEAKKAHLFEQDSVDQLEVSRLNERIKTLKSQLSSIESEQQVEEKVAEAQAQVSQSLESITFGSQTVSLKELTVNEPARQIVYAWISQHVSEQAAQHAKEAAALKASYEAQLQGEKDTKAELNYQIAQLQQRANDLTNALNQTEAERDNAKAEIADRDSKLKNAAAEIDRLNSQVEDLRTEIAVGARGAVSVVGTNLNADLGELMRQFNDAKPAIYNLHWKDDHRKNRYIANLAETGEEIEFSYLEKGKYREVTAEEAERFRAEHAANQGETSNEPDRTDDIQDTPLDVIDLPQVPSFPGEPEISHAYPANSGDTPVSEVVEEARSIHERLASLEARVNRLENGNSEAA